MLSNQRYFPIYDANGELTREFVIVSNGNPACSQQVIDGNERVQVPAWLEVDIEKLQGSVLALPNRDQIDLDITR